jgi:hypothetical protein
MVSCFCEMYVCLVAVIIFLVAVISLYLNPLSILRSRDVSAHCSILLTDTFTPLFCNDEVCNNEVQKSCEFNLTCTKNVL